MLSGILLLIVLGNYTHGWKIESSDNRNAFYTICGINLYRHVADSYRHGFVFTYINHGLKLESIIKSKPNI
jgi:hypothetical protein